MRKRGRAISCIAITVTSIVLAFNCRAQPVPEPARAIAPDDFVELQSKSSCMDSCPIYSVRVRADGTVTWNGMQGVQTKGSATRHVSADAARALIDRYLARGFWSLSDQGGGGEDGPEVTTTLHIGGREKSIGGTPDWDIYRAVGALAGTYEWIRGDPQVMNLDGLLPPDNAFGPKPGVTDLMRAASAGNLMETERQLKAGAKVNAQDASGFTALMYASWRPNLQVLQSLIKAGANPNIRSGLGQTAIMAASAFQPLSTDNIRALVAAGGDVNAQDDNGESALMFAAGLYFDAMSERADPAVTAFLLAAGARADLRDKSERTAADHVAMALSRVASESQMLGTLEITNRAERQSELDVRRAKLEQVRDLLLRPKIEVRE